LLIVRLARENPRYRCIVGEVGKLGLRGLGGGVDDPAE